MSVSDKDEMLIKPQVMPATSPLARTVVDEAAEKKRRIDEALQHYESTHPAQGVITPSMPPGVTHQAPKSKPTARSEKDKAPLFNPRSHTLAKLKPVRPAADIPINATKPDILVPTHIDPDAPIAAAVAEAKKREEEQKAAEEAEATKLASRYRQPDSIDFGVFASRKFLKYTAAWLLAIPLAIILYHVTAGLGGVSGSNILGICLLVIEYTLGAYGAFGWIPLVVFYIRAYKNQ